MNKELTCIICPRGCTMNIEEVEGQLEISGNSCQRGKTYAIQEIRAPMRTLTTTIKIENALFPRLPVKTSAPIPKEMCLEISHLCKTIQVEAPIAINTVIIKSVNGLDVDIVASRSMEKTNEKNS